MRSSTGRERAAPKIAIGEAARQALALNLVVVVAKKPRSTCCYSLSSLFSLFELPLLQAAPSSLAHRTQGHNQGPAAAAASASSDPEAAPYHNGGDASLRGKLPPHLSHSRPAPFGGLPPSLDARSLEKFKSQAMAKARAVQSSLIAAVKSGGGIGGAAASPSSHGGFGVVVPPASTAAAAAPATALSALSAKLGRLCEKFESSRATALACRCGLTFFFQFEVSTFRRKLFKKKKLSKTISFPFLSTTPNKKKGPASPPTSSTSSRRTCERGGRCARRAPRLPPTQR